eukprot:scaffold48362_cov15-Tisochrysis_lutea.AAC.1
MPPVLLAACHGHRHTLQRSSLTFRYKQSANLEAASGFLYKRSWVACAAGCGRWAWQVPVDSMLGRLCRWLRHAGPLVPLAACDGRGHRAGGAAAAAVAGAAGVKDAAASSPAGVEDAAASSPAAAAAGMSGAACDRGAAGA